MGLLTLLQLREEVLFDLGNRGDTTADSGTQRGVNSTRLNLWANQTLRHIAHPAVFDFPQVRYRFPITLVDGTAQYTFNPDPAAPTVEITGLRFMSYVDATTDDLTVRRRRLMPRSDQWFANKQLQSGEPNTYAIEGDQVLLSPIPSATEAGNVVVLHSQRTPATLSADGATSPLPTQWDELWILGTRWRAELHLGLLDLAALTQQAYGALLNEYKSTYDLNAEDWEWMSPVRVGQYMETT